MEIRSSKERGVILHRLYGLILSTNSHPVRSPPFSIENFVFASINVLVRHISRCARTNNRGNGLARSKHVTNQIEWNYGTSIWVGLSMYATKETVSPNESIDIRETKSCSSPP